VRVPAKVNVHLGVGAVRSDGFHELTTVFQAVSIFDEVTASPASGLQVSVAGEGARRLPPGRANLAGRAAVLLAEHVGVPANVRLEIVKAIPVSGGMAGGSADAAAALVACAALWGVAPSAAELAALAARLGSDATFPLVGGTALGTGRGEQLRPLATAGGYDWVFAFADFGISSGAAYAELDRLRAAALAPTPIGPPDELVDALCAGDVAAVAAALGNDLQPAALALQPSLPAVLDAGVAHGALAGVVSGSGPTCAFLCADPDSAARLSAVLDSLGVARATRVATGPMAGAAVVG
jgi:4-diphosphocytidyl-2-C-methyl-D-erythritol kinase